MVRERNAASAALVVAVITLSQWPVVDSSPLQFTIFLYGGVLVAALGIFEWVRAIRVVGSVWVLSSCGGYMSLSEGFPWVDFVAKRCTDGSKQSPSLTSPSSLRGAHPAV